MSTSIGETRIAAFGNTRMHFQVSGSPTALPDIVLDHGGSGSADDWTLIVPMLAPHARVLTYDRAGMGDSPADGLGCGAPAVSSRLAQLVDHAGIRKPFILVGYSLGGLYTRHYAQVHAADVAGVVLVDTTPTGFKIKEGLVAKVMRMLWVFHWLARLGLGPVYLRLKGQWNDKTRRALKRFARPEFLPNMGAELSAIVDVQAAVEKFAAQPRHPTLAVLAGVAPPRMPPDEVVDLRRMHDELAQKMPAPLSRQVVIETAHHGNLVSDAAHAAQLAEYILEFARSLPAKPAA